MKVKNNYVKIQCGNKTYIRKNMLLDKYIKRIFDGQLDLNHLTSKISSCFIKLDTPIENVDYDTELTRNDFDITLFGGTSDSYEGENKFNIISERNKNSIRINYLFNNEGLFYANGQNYYASDIKLFSGRKITAIGFGYVNTVFTFLDTSNMNIIINGNEGINVTREDIFQCDGVCSGFEYPLHLVNDSALYDSEYEEQDNVSTLIITEAQLYSVGFGNVLGLMEEEYLIGDVQTSRDDTSITLDLNRIKKIGHYPSEDLHLGFYPTIDNSKYIIFKYRLYKHKADNTNTYLDKYYTMSKPNENFGDLEIKLKLERL